MPNFERDPLRHSLLGILGATDSFGNVDGNGGGRVWYYSANNADNFANACSVAPTNTRSSPKTHTTSAGAVSQIGYNRIRNSTMQGATAGSPGANPTNWVGSIVPTGATRTQSLQTVNGVASISNAIAGSTLTAGAVAWEFDSASVTAASAGQTWTASYIAALTDGSVAGATFQVTVREYDGAQAFLRQTITAYVPTATPTRVSVTGTLGASVAFVTSSVRVVYDGSAVNFTLQIGAPQLEQASSMGEFSPTTNAANSALYRDFDPTTLALLGHRFEETRTNSIRNNTMQGAVAGTPGTLPTNWASATNDGLSKQVVGFGTENGISYIDYRYFGTTTGTVGNNINFDTSTAIAAANGQTWSESVFVTVSGGSTANITNIILRQSERDGAGASLTNHDSIITVAAGGLAAARKSATSTNTNASTAFLQPQLLLTYGSGVAIDITLRIGLPQLEQGTNPTSPILTTNAAVTRSADVDSLLLSNIPGAGSLSAGTMVVWAYGPDTDASRVEMHLDDGTSNNRIFLSSNSGVPRAVAVTAGATQADISGSTWTRGVLGKLAVAWDASGALAYFNGARIGTPSGAITVPAMTTLRMGLSVSGAAQPNQPIQYAALYNVKKTPAQLQALTL